MAVIEARCKTCNHIEIDKINEMLISGISPVVVSKKFKLHVKSVTRHKEKHLPKVLVKSQQLKEEQKADELLTKLESIYDKAWDLMRQAEQNRKYQPAVSALKEARSCLELTGKLIGEIKTGHTVNIHYNPQWVELRGTIFSALEDYPEARLKLASELSKIEDPEVMEGEIINGNTN